MPALATSSTGNPAAGPGDPVTSSVYQKSADLSIVKGKYSLGQGQCFVFFFNSVVLYCMRQVIASNEETAEGT